MKKLQCIILREKDWDRDRRRGRDRDARYFNVMRDEDGTHVLYLKALLTTFVSVYLYETGLIGIRIVSIAIAVVV